MGKQHSNPVVQPARTDDRPSPLFGWKGAGIVLLGDRRDGGWAVARGWTGADALTDVRCWHFADGTLFARQMRRLVEEATGDPVAARAFGAEALAWANRDALPAAPADRSHSDV